MEDKLRQYDLNMPAMEVLHKALAKYEAHLLYHTIVPRIV
jgi:hypothetical protein